MSRQDADVDCDKILDNKNIDLNNYRKLVKSYIDLVSCLAFSSYFLTYFSQCIFRDILQPLFINIFFVCSIFIVPPYFGLIKFYP